MDRFLFPEWTETLKKAIGAISVAAPVFLIALAYGWGVTPEAYRIGYQPEQPVPYSHALHADELAIDCRYCHIAVDQSHRASIPAASVCMNCHATIRQDSKLLAPVVAAYEEGLEEAKEAGSQAAAAGEDAQLKPSKALKWVRVYDLPDYVFFNHSAHVTRGVGCESCHGRVDRMEEVYQATALTMEWCLDCHNDPAGRVRDPSEVTVMGYQAPEGSAVPENVNPPINCSTCHR